MSNLDLFTSTKENKPKNQRQVFSVGELNRRVKQLLEIHLPLLWVEGEISNLSRPSSGHWYFTLKDDQAQVRCAMFRSRSAMLKFRPKDGDKLLLRARVSLYEGRGDYQLIVEHMEEAGFGLLQKQFLALKEKLLAEGLFEQSHKKALPTFPKHLGVITSASGAAVRDVIAVLRRRYPLLKVSIIPVAVQGEDASEQIIAALKLADALAFDALLLCRGGGSIEDLWAFNNETLARTIFQCKTPIVSAVGHETDFTISDFVADLRAATPSAAAELLSPDATKLLQHFQNLELQFISSVKQRLSSEQKHLQQIRRLIRDPGQQLEAWSQRLDHLELRIRKAGKNQLLTQQKRLAEQIKVLHRLSPALRLKHDKTQLQTLSKRLVFSVSQQVQTKQSALKKAMQLLNIVSPLATLERGYAIVFDSDGNILRDSQKTRAGDSIKIRLASGELKGRVDEIKR